MLISFFRMADTQERIPKGGLLAADAGDGRGPGRNVFSLFSFFPDADRPSHFFCLLKATAARPPLPAAVASMQPPIPPRALPPTTPAAAAATTTTATTAPRMFGLNGGDVGSSAALAAAGFAALAPPPAPAPVPSPPLWAAPPKGKRSSAKHQQQSKKNQQQPGRVPTSWARAAERVLGHGAASSTAPATVPNLATPSASAPSNDNGAPTIPFSQFILKK
jgi:hypothetical protein